MYNTQTSDVLDCKFPMSKSFPEAWVWRGCTTHYIPDWVYAHSVMMTVSSLIHPHERIRKYIPGIKFTIVVIIIISKLLEALNRGKMSISFVIWMNEIIIEILLSPEWIWAVWLRRHWFQASASRSVTQKRIQKRNTFSIKMGKNAKKYKRKIDLLMTTKGDLFCAIHTDILCSHE